MSASYSADRPVERSDGLPGNHASKLAALERDRVGAWARVSSATWLGRFVGGALGLGGVSYFFGPPGIEGWPIFAAGILYGVWRLGGMARERAMKRVDAALDAFRAYAVGAAAERRGFTHRSRDFQPVGLQDFIEARLIERGWDRIVFRDEIVGRHAGRYAASWGVFAEEKKPRLTISGGRLGMKSEWVTMVRGRAYIIDWDREFRGRTYLYRESFTPQTPDGAFAIGVGDPAFESAFRLYTTDGVEGHYLFDPLTIERFVALETLLKGRNPRGAFIGGKLLLLVDGDENLPYLDPAKPFDAPQTLARIDGAMESAFSALDLLIRDR
jgi:hypothetical protein